MIFVTVADLLGAYSIVVTGLLTASLVIGVAIFGTLALGLSRIHVRRQCLRLRLLSLDHDGGCLGQ